VKIKRMQEGGPRVMTNELVRYSVVDNNYINNKHEHYNFCIRNVCPFNFYSIL
jgi:hypothetical protein